MKHKSFLLLMVALLTTIATHAYNFQSGDLYYYITSDTTVEVTYQEGFTSNNYKGLTTATIPETVTYNGTTYSVTSIGDNAFCRCTSLISITIGNSVTSIGYEAFYECSALTSITLSNSVTSIVNMAFSGCSSLISITIPNSVTSIGGSAFDRCSSLTSIVVESGNTMYDSRENCNAIIETASNTLIVGCQSTTIPYSVTSIGYAAFEYCSALTSITLPNSVTTIGHDAFKYCSALTSITLPNSVTSIGYDAFKYCYALTSITIPNSVTTIGGGAFYEVPNIVYSGTATGSPWGARSVNGYVDGYLVYADETKTKLLACSAAATGEITIPNSVTSIEKYAFYPCSSLTSITIPNSVTSIGESAFWGCSALTSITLPNSVTTIKDYAFGDCSSLTSITIPNSVTSIGDWAFAYCSSLNSIAIPNSVTSIGDDAFRNCYALTSITCLATIPPTCSSNSFRDVPRTIPLYVPAESVEAYKAADIWKEFDVQALSTDATLYSLTYDGMLVPSFDADTLHYTVDLPSETVAVPVVDAVANDSGATLTIHQATTLPGEASVEVIAADNTTRQTYTIYFSKKSTPTDISDRPDTTGTDSDKGAEKLLRNGQVLIIRNGKTYNMMGQRL